MQLIDYPQEIGIYYHQTRLARGYSLGDVVASNHYLDKSQLSRFENGKSMLSVDRFIMAVNGLNMTLGEFFILNATRSNQYQYFPHKIRSYVISKDSDSLKKLIRARAKLKIDKIFNILIKAAILEVSGENLITKNEKKFLNHYLETIQQWTIFDIDVFSMCLKVLEESEVYDLGQDMLASDELSKILVQNASSVKKATLHLYVFLIAKAWYKQAKKIEKVLTQLITENDVAEKIAFHIYKNFLVYKKERSPEILANILRDFDSLKRLEVTGIVDRFEKLFNYTINKHDYR